MKEVKGSMGEGEREIVELCFFLGDALHIVVIHCTKCHWIIHQEVDKTVDDNIAWSY